MKSSLIFFSIIVLIGVSNSAFSQKQKTSKWDCRVSVQEFNDRIDNDEALKLLHQKQNRNLKLFIATGIGAISYAAILQSKYGSEFSEIPIGHSVAAMGLTGFALFSGLKAGFLREKKIKLYHTKFPSEEGSFIVPSKDGIGLEIHF